MALTSHMEGGANVIIEAVTCGVPVLEGYGMTETSTAATGQTPDEYRFGSVGRSWRRFRGQSRRPRSTVTR